jgi:hypothetical protein
MPQIVLLLGVVRWPRREIFGDLDRSVADQLAGDLELLVISGEDSPGAFQRLCLFDQLAKRNGPGVERYVDSFHPVDPNGSSGQHAGQASQLGFSLPITVHRKSRPPNFGGWRQIKVDFRVSQTQILWDGSSRSLQRRRQPRRQPPRFPDAILPLDPIAAVRIEKTDDRIVPSGLVERLEDRFVLGVVVVDQNGDEFVLDRFDQKRVRQRTAAEIAARRSAGDFLEQDQDRFAAG